MILALLLLLDASARREPLDLARCALAREAPGAPSGVFAVSVSRGLGLAAAGRRDGRVRVWDATSWAVVADFEAHRGYCYAAVFSPDGLRLATAGLDGAVILWTPGAWARERTLRVGGEPVTSLAFGAGGRLVGGGPSGAWVWDRDGAETALPGHPLGAAAVAARGARAATAGYDGAVRLWDLETGRALKEFEGHAGGAFAVAFHPRGRSLVSAGGDGRIRAWPLADGEATLRIAAPERVEVRSLAFAGGGLVAAGRSGVLAWDAEGRPFALSRIGAAGVAIGIEGREIVVTGSDNQLRVWTSGAAGLPSVGSDRPGGFFGVSYGDGQGALVETVLDNSEAERVGIRPGDVITAVDGTSITRSDDFLRFMRGTREGDEVDLRFRRGEDVRFTRVKLGRWEERR
ncbi:MAG TPA: PDZ domain-containing protein [Planctomycetota bacterium]